MGADLLILAPLLSHPNAHGQRRNMANRLCATSPLKAAEFHSAPVRGAIQHQRTRTRTATAGTAKIASSPVPCTDSRRRKRTALTTGKRSYRARSMMCAQPIAERLPVSSSLGAQRPQHLLGVLILRIQQQRSFIHSARLMLVAFGHVGLTQAVPGRPGFRVSARSHLEIADSLSSLREPAAAEQFTA